MTTPQLLAVVGMAGSGKGTLVDYLAKKLQAPKIYFGGMVYEEVEKRGLDSVKDEKMVREHMREQEGPAVLAKRAAARATELLENGAPYVILDGVYSWSEDKYLREIFADKYATVAVISPRALRYERVVARIDSHRSYSTEAIAARDIQEIENLEKGGPIAYADYSILNNGDFEKFYSDADTLCNALGLQ